MVWRLAVILRMLIDPGHGKVISISEFQVASAEPMHPVFLDIVRQNRSAGDVPAAVSQHRVRGIKCEGGTVGPLCLGRRVYPLAVLLLAGGDRVRGDHRQHPIRLGRAS